MAEIIRGHIGYDGLVMSDDLSMQALVGTFRERARGRVRGRLRRGPALQRPDGGDGGGRRGAPVLAATPCAGPMRRSGRSATSRSRSTLWMPAPLDAALALTA